MKTRLPFSYVEGRLKIGNRKGEKTRGGGGGWGTRYVKNLFNVSGGSCPSV